MSIEKFSKPMKNDMGKLRYDLLPILPLEQVVKVITHGSCKYADNNWMAVVSENPDRYYAAALRHIASWRKNEKADKDSKLPVLAHATCCLLFLLWNDLKLDSKKKGKE